MKFHRIVLVLSVAALLVAGSALAVAQEGSAKGKSHAHPAMSGEKKGHALDKAENISGTVAMLESSGETITLSGSNGVPYDFRLTKHTHVTIGGKSAKPDDLKNQVNKQATIEFVPMSDGNLAKTVTVS